jgi:hypothetical protein
MYIIKESTLHRNITREIQPLMNAKGYSFVKVASISIRKNEHLYFEEIKHSIIFQHLISPYTS